MPEHTPAPTPPRAVYGFVLYLGSTTSFALYCIWAFLPDSLLQYLGFTYLPQKYWAVAIPIHFCVAFALFGLFMYPSCSLAMVPGLNDLRTITDNNALEMKEVPKGGIPPVYDICISKVCRHLYIKPDVKLTRKACTK